MTYVIVFLLIGIAAKLWLIAIKLGSIDNTLKDMRKTEALKKVRYGNVSDLPAFTRQLSDTPREDWQ